MSAHPVFKVGGKLHQTPPHLYCSLLYKARLLGSFIGSEAPCAKLVVPQHPCGWIVLRRSSNWRHCDRVACVRNAGPYLNPLALFIYLKQQQRINEW